jgi:hypothetical protein
MVIGTVNAPAEARRTVKVKVSAAGSRLRVKLPDAACGPASMTAFVAAPKWIALSRFVPVAAAAGAPDLAEQRFRSNIVIDGLEAWEEQNWLDRHVYIGDVKFKVVRPKVRCLATHANPLTGERDLPIMKTLVKAFPQEKPTFAVAMTTAEGGGTIRVGDRVRLSD